MIYSIKVAVGEGMNNQIESTVSTPPAMALLVIKIKKLSPQGNTNFQWTVHESLGYATYQAYQQKRGKRLFLICILLANNINISKIARVADQRVKLEYIKREYLAN